MNCLSRVKAVSVVISHARVLLDEYLRKYLPLCTSCTVHVHRYTVETEIQRCIPRTQEPAEYSTVCRTAFVRKFGASTPQ